MISKVALSYKAVLSFTFAVHAVSSVNLEEL